MSIELQLIDCNCNDCYFMQRDFAAYQEKLDRHNADRLYKWEVQKKRLLASGAKESIQEANKMKFQKDSKINEGFGLCTKFNKNVTFIPATCQIHTQKCFEHRKLYKPDTNGNETENKPQEKIEGE